MTQINPFDMSAAEQYILSEFISQNPDKIIIKKNIFYHVYYNGFEKKLTFFVSKDIIRRERKAGKKGFRFEVKGDEILGEGSFAKIYPSHTLFLENGFLCPTDKQNKRVIREQDSDEEESDFHILQAVPHLCAKPSIFDAGKTYTVIKRMPGEDLQSILDKKTLMTTEQKLQLVMALFNAYKGQVLDNGLVHRDIKPANIMVSFTSGNTMPEVNIIDFDLARKVGDQSNELLGTPEFYSPEMLDWHRKNVTQRSFYFCNSAIDIYALSKIVCELLSENYFVDSMSMKKLNYLAYKLKINISLQKEEIEWIAKFGLNNPTLFKEETDLSILHQYKLKSLIQSMSYSDPNKRLSIDVAIETLNSIIKERAYPKLLYAKLLCLQEESQLYHILSCYPHLFSVKKILMESDEKRINRHLNTFLTAKADLDAIEKDVNEITKARDAIKKSNNSQVFNDMFIILKRLTYRDSKEIDKTPKNKFETEVKLKLLTYVKKHMADLITKQDIYASKRLKAMTVLLNYLEKSDNFEDNIQDTLKRKLAIITSPQFDGSLSQSKFNVTKNRYIPAKTAFFPTQAQLKNIVTNATQMRSFIRG
ncbi:MAG: protein kinase [Rickettsiella sp.]|nr:protein kinase [Rickettsiella sp.]